MSTWKQNREQPLLIQQVSFYQCIEKNTDKQFQSNRGKYNFAQKRKLSTNEV